MPARLGDGREPAERGVFAGPGRLTGTCHERAVGLLRSLDECVIISNARRTADILAGRVDKDIDVLVSPAAWRKASAALASAGFLIQLKHGSPEKALYFTYDFESRHLLMLDFYWRYLHRRGQCWFDLRPEVRAAVLATAQRDDQGLRHAASEFRLLFVLLGIVLKGNPRGQYAEEIAESAAAVSALGRYLERERGLDAEATGALLGLLREGTQASEEHVARFLAAVCFEVPRLRTLAAWYGKYLSLAGPVLSRPAPMVSVVGIDGAGKSTLSALLERRFPIKVKSMYWASRYMLLPTTKLYRRLERRVLPTDIRRTDIPEQRAMPESKPKAYGWKALFKLPLLAVLNANKYAEYLAKYALLRLHRLRGCVTITDRYVCDEEFEYNDRFYRVNRWLYRRLYPRPDVLVIATADPETIHARKPTIPSATAAHYQETYRRIGEAYARRGTRVVEVSSDDGTPEENAGRVVEVVFGEWGR